MRNLWEAEAEASLYGLLTSTSVPGFQKKKKVGQKSSNLGSRPYVS